MILIFGGTTEGRLAAEVCEEAGKPFYYSTRGNSQAVELTSGIRLTGSMEAEQIRTFCTQHDIRCIIDAAHPFAESLHRNIGGITDTIRIERKYSAPLPDVIYCSGFDDAVARLSTEHDIHCLLALTGVNTISKLKPYWTSHRTLFRILNREESIATAQRHGLQQDNILYYDDTSRLPSVEDEMTLMQRCGCDAILTKESGQSGGYESKVEAARRLGIRTFVVKAPPLPYPCTHVTGRHGLRRAIERIVPDFFPLHTGLTTGACATAAAKAAYVSLLTGDCPEESRFELPDGEILTIPVECIQPGTATVTKEHNDDPDVTRGCRITATVTLTDHTGEIRFLQGEGVGTVTLPGLGIPVGEPAVNPTPRSMIRNEILSVGMPTGGVDVTISVAGGAELALRTFNHKVGVTGGISILGTSGIVKPLSNEAFVSSIRREMDVARAIGCTEIGLVSGMKSEVQLTADYPCLRCIHYGNFIGEALKAAHDAGIRRVTLAIMIGKAVKLAEGNMDTHSHKVSMNKEFLSSLAPAYAEQIGRITMARQLWTFMPDSFFRDLEHRCYTHCRTAFPDGTLVVKILCDNTQR